MLKEHNRVVLAICYINETDNDKYKNNFLDYIIRIYRVFLAVKSSLKKVILKESSKSRENIFYISRIKNIM